MFLKEFNFSDNEANAEFFKPEKFPFAAHFINDPIVPGSVILEFSLQAGVAFLMKKHNIKINPLIGDARSRFFKKYDGESSLYVRITSNKEFDSGEILIADVRDENLERIMSAKLTYSFNYE